MKKIIAGFMVLAMAMLLNAPVASAWYYELVNPDHDFTMELYFVPDAGTSNTVKDFTFNFLYDGDLASGHATPPPDPGDTLADTLSFVSYTHDADALGLDEFLAVEHYPEYDLLWNFAGDWGPTGGAVISERTLFGTFTYSGDAFLDGYEDMWFARYDDSFDSMVDGQRVNIIANPEKFKELGTSTPVPIPGAVLLLGSGLLGLVGIGRRRLAA